MWSTILSIEVAAARFNWLFASTKYLKELKAFSKVSLNKGEKKTVELTIDVSKLAFYDESISDWSIEKGDYKIYVGNASNNISKKLDISVK